MSEPRQPGRISEPWKSKAAVPKSIWDNNKWGYPNWSDEKYLAALNDQHYWYWLRSDAEKKKAKASQGQLNGMGDRVLCAGDYCERTVLKTEWRKGNRLCSPCQAMIKERGQFSHIRYVGEASC